MVTNSQNCKAIRTHCHTENTIFFLNRSPNYIINYIVICKCCLTTKYISSLEFLKCDSENKYISSVQLETTQIVFKQNFVLKKKI